MSSTTEASPASISRPSPGNQCGPNTHRVTVSARSERDLHGGDRRHGQQPTAQPAYVRGAGRHRRPGQHGPAPAGALGPMYTAVSSASSATHGPRHRLALLPVDVGRGCLVDEQREVAAYQHNSHSHSTRRCHRHNPSRRDENGAPSQHQGKRGEGEPPGTRVGGSHEVTRFPRSRWARASALREAPPIQRDADSVTRLGGGLAQRRWNSPPTTKMRRAAVHKTLAKGS